MAVPIALDVGNNGGSTTSNTLTFSHTCTGTNLILWVSAANFNTDGGISGITYGGVSMTQASSTVISGNKTVYLYYLINPATSANNVVVTRTGSTGFNMEACSASYTGAKQSTQPDVVGNNSGSATSLSKSITTTTDNCWIVCAGASLSTASTSTNLTSRGAQTNCVIGDSNALIHPAGAYSSTIASSPSDSLAMVVASFKPVPPTVNTVTIADTQASTDAVATVKTQFKTIADTASSVDSLIAKISFHNILKNLSTWINQSKS